MVARASPRPDDYFAPEGVHRAREGAPVVRRRRGHGARRQGGEGPAPGVERLSGVRSEQAAKPIHAGSSRGGVRLPCHRGGSHVFQSWGEITELCPLACPSAPRGGRRAAGVRTRRECPRTAETAAKRTAAARAGPGRRTRRRCLRAVCEDQRQKSRDHFREVRNQFLKREDTRGAIGSCFCGGAWGLYRG